MHAIRDVAKKQGVDATGWLIGSAYDYESNTWGRTPACHEIHEIIEKGDERIRAVEQLLGRD